MDVKERMIQYGSRSLNDKELLGLIIGEQSSTLLMHVAEQDIFNITRMEYGSLKNIGLTSSRAQLLIAAIELGRRRYADNRTSEKQSIRGSKDAFEALRYLYEDLHEESFWILLLNRANKVVAKVHISSGGMAGTVVDSKTVFRKALQYSAAGIILSHNHPSGNLHPSQADLDLTKKIKEAAQLLDISVLDHVIIHGNAYFSFADEGLL